MRASLSKRMQLQWENNKRNALWVYQNQNGEKGMHLPEIESRASAWKALMLPLHHRCLLLLFRVQSKFILTFHFQNSANYFTVMMLCSFKIVYILKSAIKKQRKIQRNARPGIDSCSWQKMPRGIEYVLIKIMKLLILPFASWLEFSNFPDVRLI